MDNKNVKMTLSEWRKYEQNVERKNKKQPFARGTNTTSMDEKKVETAWSSWKKYLQGEEKEDKKEAIAREMKANSKSRALGEVECTCTGWSVEHTCGAHGHGVKPEVKHLHESVHHAGYTFSESVASFGRPTKTVSARSAKSTTSWIPKVRSSHEIWSAYVDQEIDSATVKTPAQWSELLHKVREAAHAHAWGSANTYSDRSSAKNAGCDFGYIRSGSKSSINNKFTPSESYDAASSDYSSEKYAHPGGAWGDNSEKSEYARSVPSCSPDGNATPVGRPYSRRYSVSNGSPQLYAPPVYRVPGLQVPPVNHMPDLTGVAADDVFGPDVNTSSQPPYPHPDYYRTYTHQANNMPGSAAPPTSPMPGPYVPWMRAGPGDPPSGNAQPSHLAGLYTAHDAYHAAINSSKAANDGHNTQSSTYDRYRGPASVISSDPFAQHLWTELQKHRDYLLLLEVKCEHQRAQNDYLVKEIHEAETKASVAEKHGADSGTKSYRSRASTIEGASAPTVRLDKSETFSDYGASSAHEVEVQMPGKTHVSLKPASSYLIVVPCDEKSKPVMFGTVKHMRTTDHLTTNPLAINQSATFFDVVAAWCYENALGTEGYILLYRGKVVDPSEMITSVCSKHDHPNFEIIKLPKQSVPKQRKSGGPPLDFAGW